MNFPLPDGRRPHMHPTVQILIVKVDNGYTIASTTYDANGDSDHACEVALDLANAISQTHNIMVTELTVMTRMDEHPQDSDTSKEH